MASHCAEKCNDEPKFDDEQDEMYDYAWWRYALASTVIHMIHET